MATISYPASTLSAAFSRVRRRPVFLPLSPVLAFIVLVVRLGLGLGLGVWDPDHVMVYLVGELGWNSSIPDFKNGIVPMQLFGWRDEVVSFIFWWEGREVME
jgi:hypothetical protein